MKTTPESVLRTTDRLGEKATLLSVLSDRTPLSHVHLSVTGQDTRPIFSMDPTNYQLPMVSLGLMYRVTGLNGGGPVTGALTGQGGRYGG